MVTYLGKKINILKQSLEGERLQWQEKNTPDSRWRTMVVSLVVDVYFSMIYQLEMDELLVTKT